MAFKVDNNVYINYNNVMLELMGKLGLKNETPPSQQPPSKPAPAIQIPQTVPAPAAPSAPAAVANPAPVIPLTPPPVSAPTVAQTAEKTAPLTERKVTPLPSLTSNELKAALKKARKDIQSNIKEHKKLERTEFWKSLANTISAVIWWVLIVALFVTLIALPVIVGLYVEGILDLELTLKILGGFGGAGCISLGLGIYSNDVYSYQENERNKHLLYSRRVYELFDRHFDDKNFTTFLNGFDEKLRPELVKRADFHDLFEKFNIILKHKKLENVTGFLGQQEKTCLDLKFIESLRSEKNRLHLELYDTECSYKYSGHIQKHEEEFEAAKKKLLEALTASAPAA